MKRMLVVTGSRALMMDRGGSEASALWAVRTRHGFIQEATPRPDLVVNGGARGPDAMASSMAFNAYIPLREFRLDGGVYSERDEYPSSRWLAYVPGGTSVSPLERNEAMIAHVAKARDEGWGVHVLALVAPWAETQGTMHTVGLACKAGLETTVLVCPREYAGKAVAR